MPRLLFVLLLSLYAATVAATPVKDLYVVQVPVENQDREVRLEALKQAFEEVLVRVTGDGSVAGNPEAEALLRMAPSFVQRFRYLRPEAPQQEEAPAWMLRVVFDGRRIERALSERGLPVWGRDRPAVLAWVAVLDGGRRYLIGEQSHEPEREVLRDEARRRGVPLMFPLLDLQDQRQVRIADLVGGFEEPIDAASQRYASDAVLIGTVRRAGAAWLGRWRLREGDETARFESTADTLEGVLRQGIDGAASWLASWHARTAFAGSGEGVLLQVQGVAGLADFVRLRDYLAGLDGVEAVVPQRVAPPRAVLEVRLRGTARDLERMISLGQVLAPEDTPGDALSVIPSAGNGAAAAVGAEAGQAPRPVAAAPGLRYRLLH